jgi:hypothetical protein
MLHDPFVEVTCDGEGCRETIDVEMEFFYLDYSGKNGYYDHEDGKIEAKLVEEFEWIVVPSDDEDESNKHYCNKGCVPEVD